MTREQDSAGHTYIETPSLKGDKLRATFVPAATAGYKTDVIRLQIRRADGKVLFPGTEIPIQILDAAIESVRALARESKL